MTEAERYVDETQKMCNATKLHSKDPLQMDLNVVYCNVFALVNLLISKKVFTREEADTALADAMVDKRKQLT